MVASSSRTRSQPKGNSETRPRYVSPLQDAAIVTLGLEHDNEAKSLIRRALKDAWPAARHYGWQVCAVRELEPAHQDVGYMEKDGTLFIKVRDPSVSRQQAGIDCREAAKDSRGHFYQYSFILATILHELTHLSFLGHGKAFYKCLQSAVRICGEQLPTALRQEVYRQIYAELLNAVCENDQRRAKALLGVMPEAAKCPRLGAGPQTALDYAAQYGRVALTSLLLEARAEVDTRQGMPPLARAAAQGNAKTARVLLAAGASIASVDPELRSKLKPWATDCQCCKQEAADPGSMKAAASSLPRMTRNESTEAFPHNAAADRRIGLSMSCPTLTSSTHVPTAKLRESSRS
eukprot:CAMPEP_0178443048 /NCGR_PEP_ID=MMETSP0689_2-20121128/38591_1 /TAXON_ID=160604 /ORGANISM="Amphidinium massartii, Strain CS-259" /LENGTH=347 /DNA_ID=CAMNT_0020066837 /DNA_START=36 /DNA_END=1076 /DNA_ORIENTATION=+